MNVQIAHENREARKFYLDGRHAARLRRWLPVAAVALPLLLTGGAMLLSLREAFRDAEREVMRAADGAAEYAGRVLDGHLAAADRVNDRLRGLSDEEIRLQERELNLALHALAAETPRIEGAYVLDRTGLRLVSANAYPLPDSAPIKDRSYDALLLREHAPSAVVSRVFRGQDGKLYFSVVRRRRDTGNADLPRGAFDGEINVSVDLELVGAGLRSLLGEAGDAVALVKSDGEVLARSRGYASEPPIRLDPRSPMWPYVQRGVERGMVHGPSGIDGVWRMAAYRHVTGWPVYVAAGRSRDAVLASWATIAGAQLAVGLPATGLLLLLVVVVRRRELELAEANLTLEQNVSHRTAALSESEARLRRVQHIGRVGGFEIELRSGNNNRSAEYMRLHGLTPAARVEGHADWVARLHPDDRSRAEMRFLNAVSDETGIVEYAQEYRIIIPGGQTRWVAARAEVERDSRGRAVRVVGAHLDITELKAAQTEAADSAARLRAALRGARFGVWERHLPTASANWDTRAIEIYGGLTPHRALPSLAEWRDRIHPDDRAARIATIDGAVLPGGPDNYDVKFRFRRDDGSYAWIVAHGCVVERDPLTGHGLRLAGVIQDLSEQHAAEAALQASEERLRLAQEAGGVGSWEWTVGTGELYWSESCHRLHGTDPSVPPTLESWRSGIHPEDWEVVVAAIEGTLKSEATTWATEFRFTRRSDGVVRWMSGRGSVEREATTGRALRFRGIVLDITPQKSAEELQRLLIREIDHRAKNALAVVQAAVRLTPRDDTAAYAQAIEGRVKALARAHTLLAQGRWTGADLLTLARGELAPFLLPAGNGNVPEVIIDGPVVQVSSAVAQGLSMALHELATNATKHGALSVPAGQLVVKWSVDHATGQLALRWEERGGPPVAAPPSRRGFGTRVLEGTIKNQLGGTMHCHWESEGLVCEMAVPLNRSTEFDLGI